MFSVECIDILSHFTLKHLKSDNLFFNKTNGAYLYPSQNIFSSMGMILILER